MRRVLISTKRWRYGAVSGVPPAAWALQLKEQILKEQITDSSRLFKDAVLSVSSWLRSLPVRGWRTRLLSSVSGHPTRWRFVRGWFMRLLWAYEHDGAAISPFFSEKIGTLCRHPSQSLCLPGKPRALTAGRLVYRSRAWLTTTLCPGACLPGGAWGADEVLDGPFHGQKPLVSLLRPHYPQWQGG